MRLAVHFAHHLLPEHSAVLLLLIPIRFAPAAFPGGRRRAWSTSHRKPAKHFYDTSRQVWYYSDRGIFTGHGTVFALILLVTWLQCFRHCKRMRWA